MEPRPHVSYSAIQQYLRCPLQYYFQRVLKLPADVVTSGLALGGAVHAALAVHHRQLQNRRSAQDPEPDPEAVRWAFLEAYEERENFAVIEYGPRETRDKVIEQGMALVEAYLATEPPPSIRHVERALLTPLTNSAGEPLEKPLMTVVDLVYGPVEKPVVRELKTSQRAYSQSEVDAALQATCYASALHETIGVWPVVEYAVLTKTKTPRAQLLTTTRDAGQAAGLGDLVESVERAVAASIFFPIESPMNCAGCPYRAECLDWRPDRRSAEASEVHRLNGEALPC